MKAPFEKIAKADAALTRAKKKFADAIHAGLPVGTDVRWLHGGRNGYYRYGTIIDHNYTGDQVKVQSACSDSKYWICVFGIIRAGFED